MQNKWILSMLIVWSLSLTNCEKIFEDVPNTPIDNFNLLFDYLNEDYAYRDEHAFSMEELKARYRPELVANPTEQTLADIVVKIENDLLDPHIFIPFQAYDLSWIDRPDYFNTKPVEQTDFKASFLLEIDVTGTSDFFTYGVVKDEPQIGYIRIERLSNGIGGQARFNDNDWRDEIEDILKILNQRSVENMIVDMRTGAGGSNYNPQYIANRFANRATNYMVESFEVGEQKQSISFKVEPEGEHHFRVGKVALLTNNLTCSGGELFTLAMIQRENLIHIGTPTRGCAGSQVDRDLYNGWDFRLTASKTFFPDGKSSYFKTGIQPEVLIANDMDYGLSTLEDKVIKKAIELLK